MFRNLAAAVATLLLVMVAFVNTIMWLTL